MKKCCEEEVVKALQILAENIGNGSYRWLIYDKLGLNHYVDLLGLMRVNNTMSESQGGKENIKTGRHYEAGINDDIANEEGEEKCLDS